MNPQSKVRGSTTLGNLSRLACGPPEPTLSTSSMTYGSRPALTPITITSAVAASVVAAIGLFANFIVWAAPGFSPRTTAGCRDSTVGQHVVITLRDFASHGRLN